MFFSLMPSNTGVANFRPRSGRPSPGAFPAPARRSCARHTQRFNTISTGVPSDRKACLPRHDLGHDAFVAVASGHFVAHGELALGGDIDFDGFDDAAIYFLAGSARSISSSCCICKSSNFFLKAADDSLILFRMGEDLSRCGHRPGPVCAGASCDLAVGRMMISRSRN